MLDSPDRELSAQIGDSDSSEEMPKPYQYYLMGSRPSPHQQDFALFACQLTQYEDHSHNRTNRPTTAKTTNELV
jgi:hypothetical protein